MIEVCKFLHDLYTADRVVLVMANSSITRGHNLKLSRLTCRSRIRHYYFSQRIVEYWNGLPSDVVNASSVNSFKGRLDKHWKEFMFSMVLTFKTHINPPTYSGPLQFRTSSRHVRSSDHRLLQNAAARTVLGSRALSHAASTIWSSLLPDLTDAG